MRKEDNKVHAAGDKTPKPCDAYKDGFCEEMKRSCDLCHESSMKVFAESKQ